MQDIEPYYHWRNYYIASEDERSPFYGREYNEFEYTDAIYDHYIHPQWDNIGSPTLFIKIIYADYENHFAIIEMLGEWNDCINNDIMLIKREVVEEMMYQRIRKFILVGENVLNFHSSDDCYYEEWFDELEEGWVALLNFRQHILEEFMRSNIDRYFVLGGEINAINWRAYSPVELYRKIELLVQRRIGAPIGNQ